MSMYFVFMFGCFFSLFIILPLPASFYNPFARVILFALSILGYFWVKKNVGIGVQPIIFFIAPIGFALLFNPIFPIYLCPKYSKRFWAIFNLAAAYWFFLAASIAKEISNK